DLATRLFRQPLAEGATGFEEALLHVVVENAEAVTRGDQLERQRQQPVALLVVERPYAATLGGRQDRREFGQLLSADKTELLEKFVLGRQAGEHLGHRLGDLAASLDEVVGQANPVE